MISVKLSMMDLISSFSLLLKDWRRVSLLWGRTRCCDIIGDKILQLETREKRHKMSEGRMIKACISLMQFQNLFVAKISINIKDLHHDFPFPFSLRMKPDYRNTQLQHPNSPEPKSEEDNLLSCCFLAPSPKHANQRCGSKNQHLGLSWNNSRSYSSGKLIS